MGTQPGGTAGGSGGMPGVACPGEGAAPAGGSLPPFTARRRKAFVKASCETSVAKMFFATAMAPPPCPSCMRTFMRSTGRTKQVAPMPATPQLMMCSMGPTLQGGGACVCTSAMVSSLLAKHIPPEILAKHTPQETRDKRAQQRRVSVGDGAPGLRAHWPAGRRRCGSHVGSHVDMSLQVLGKLEMRDDGYGRWWI
jgi:hypothetical protein